MADSDAPNAPSGRTTGPAEPVDDSRCRTARVAVAVAAVTALVITGVASGVWGSVTGSSDGSGEKKGVSEEAGPAGTAPEADFDHDGHADLALNGNTGNTGGENGAGYIAVAYGSDDPDGPGRRQKVTQDDAGVPGKATEDANFGLRPVARDFDGDGFTDLVVSVNKRRASDDDQGEDRGLIVLWGSEKGLSSGRDGGAYLHDVPGDLEYGQTAGGDFDGDGQADLLLGVDHGKGLLKGPFDRDGRPAATDRVPEPALPERMSTVDVVAGDMNGDGTDDLVSLHRYDDPSSYDEPELAHFMAGGKDGFEPGRKLLRGADTATVGDVDKDGYGDLALGESGPGEKNDPSGTVVVLHGSKKGPDASRRTEIDQDTDGVPGKKDEENEPFGAALASGDANGDGYADIAAGDTEDDRWGKKRTGSATLIEGGPGGLTGKGARVVDQATGGRPQDLEERSTFGVSLELLDANGDGRSDLAAGASRVDDEGEAWLLPGSPDSLTGDGASSIHPADVDAPDGWQSFAEQFARR